MRIWSLHPRYLDRQGLTACWREALLAQAVLAARTKGYRHHPQLRRFRDSGRPRAAIATYLHGIADEADARGYHYDRARIDYARSDVSIEVTDGQLDYEWVHLRGKVSQRSPEWWSTIAAVTAPKPHPILRVVPGDIEPWEVR